MKLQEALSTIADTLKVNVETLTKAFDLTPDKLSTDVELELPKLKTYTNEELSTLETNLKKVGYDDGKTAGSEMAAKEIKRLSGVDLEGKDISSIVEAIVTKAKTDAGAKPNEQIDELKETIAKLQTTVSEKETENASLVSNHNKQNLEHKILGLIPENTIGLSNKTVLNDMRSNGYDVSEVDGSLTVTKNGETLKDQKLQNPLKFEDVASQYLTDKNWLKADKGGRGGGDQGGTGGSSSSIKSISDFEDYVEREGINPHSDEARAVLLEARKENNF